MPGRNDGSPGRECHIEPWITAIPIGPFRVEVGEAGTMRHALGKGGDRVMELQAWQEPAKTETEADRLAGSKEPRPGRGSRAGGR